MIHSLDVWVCLQIFDLLVKCMLALLSGATAYSWWPQGRRHLWWFVLFDSCRIMASRIAVYEYESLRYLLRAEMQGVSSTRLLFMLCFAFEGIRGRSAFTLWVSLLRHFWLCFPGCVVYPRVPFFVHSGASVFSARSSS